MRDRTMNFSKLVFHESSWPDVIGRTLTFIFNKCELELFYIEGNLSCCITKKECASFQERLASCRIEEWSDTFQPPAGIAVMDGTTWTLELFNGKKRIKEICGTNAFPPMEQWSALTSVLDEGYSIALRCGKELPIDIANSRVKLF